VVITESSVTITLLPTNFPPIRVMSEHLSRNMELDLDFGGITAGQSTVPHRVPLLAVDDGHMELFPLTCADYYQCVEPTS
jgi:hypothetical protein